MTTPPRESLAEMLAVVSLGDGRWSAELESFWGSTAKGDLLARATLAATGGDRRALASVHTAFAGRATPGVPIDLTREDTSFDRCRVRAYEGSTVRSESTFRFGGDSESFAYQTSAPLRGLPAPEDLPSETETAAKEGWAAFAVSPVETRRIGEYALARDGEVACWQGWARPRQPLPTDARVHVAALAFLSEYRSHWALELRLGRDFASSDILVVDHALWIHRTVPWDDFWLVRTTTDVGVAGRCFSRREIWTRDGAMVASAAWEAFVRHRTAGDGG